MEKEGEEIDKLDNVGGRGGDKDSEALDWSEVDRGERTIAGIVV